MPHETTTYGIVCKSGENYLQKGSIRQSNSFREKSTALRTPPLTSGPGGSATRRLPGFQFMGSVKPQALDGLRDLCVGAPRTRTILTIPSWDLNWAPFFGNLMYLWIPMTVDIPGSLEFLSTPGLSERVAMWGKVFLAARNLLARHVRLGGLRQHARCLPIPPRRERSAAPVRGMGPGNRS